jgi:segregation and condensation protein A
VSEVENKSEVKVEESTVVEAQAEPASATTLKSAKPATSKKADEQESFPFSVTVTDVYDGPLDLLLDLIRKQDIDIYNIPIAKITAQYLKYVEHIKQLDVDVAAEFIYMASLLIHIKSKLLLPKDPDAPADDDPRTELVNRLLEHERFKTAAQMLMQKQQIEEAVWTNPALKEFKDAEGTEPELAADVIDLVKTFQQILDRAKSRPMLNVDEETVSVGQMIEYMKRRLMLEDKPIRLKLLLRSIQSRQALVCSFLAILELIRLQAVLARQDATFGEIVLKKYIKFDELVAESASARDDWK